MSRVVGRCGSQDLIEELRRLLGMCPLLAVLTVAVNPGAVKGNAGSAPREDGKLLHVYYNVRFWMIRVNVSIGRNQVKINW